jgi:hypothetical protein
MGFSQLRNKMNKPKWVLEKQRLQAEEPEVLEFVGQLGVAGVVDGKLPNGDDYDYKKKRDIRSRHKLASLVEKIRTRSTNDEVEVILEE